MKKLFCLIVILLFPTLANSQPDYKYIISDFDSLFAAQTSDYQEMQGILKSYSNADSNSLPQKKDVLNSLNKIYDEWNELDSLIERANKLLFPNFSKDHQKISNLSALIDSASHNYKINLQILQEICGKYPDFETDDFLKTRLKDLNALELPAFKPKTIK
jgi:anion-transporting  ArsA/GET3 family ATPase